ncbi:hypothetical protein [Melittangium boletus]|uniref:Uncharacterized protein n=1 Tax=Melittangium boletus DSM 14713 TaxID=1294270 RepID=A0A250I8A0_9BACT|nr:hypothetical protein [Melittangium boletus]ATB27382.1 hypothetical protein MEBOL_000820 [Melittangium boletus DSM 14713]
MTDGPGSVPPPPPVFQPEEKVCGNCKLWAAHSVDHRGWVGVCRLQPERGLFPPSAPLCNKFTPRGVAAKVVGETSRRERMVRTVAPVVRRREHSPDEVVDLEGLELNMTRAELMELIREAVGEGGDAPLANKWEGGTLRLVPGKADVQSRDIPLDTFFHKIVMVRDRLRVMEQKLNAHPKLSDAEKVEMQAQITRIYGSLTSFNLLFRDKEDQFVGSKSED